MKTKDPHHIINDIVYGWFVAFALAVLAIIIGLIIQSL